MTRHALVPACTFAMLLLAGCSSQDPSDPVDPRVAAAEAAARAIPVDIDGTTGVVRGIVLDFDGDPVADAVITVRPPRTTVTTTAAGAFAVGGLEPGRHLVGVQSGPFFDEVEVDVAAGDAQPSLVRFTVEAYVVEPRVASFDRVAHTDTQVGPQNVVSWAQQNAPVEEGARVAQCEATWTAQSSMTERLDLALLLGYSGPPGGRILGPSPLVLRINTTSDGSTIDNVGISLTVPQDPSSPVAVSVEQEVAVHCDIFYGFDPDPDWTYGADGPYPVPGGTDGSR